MYLKRKNYQDVLEYLKKHHNVVLYAPDDTYVSDYFNIKVYDDYQEALAVYKDDLNPVVVSGSLYGVAEVRKRYYGVNSTSDCSQSYNFDFIDDLSSE